MGDTAIELYVVVICAVLGVVATFCFWLGCYCGIREERDRISKELIGLPLSNSPEIIIEKVGMHDGKLYACGKFDGHENQGMAKYDGVKFESFA